MKKAGQKNVQTNAPVRSPAASPYRCKVSHCLAAWNTVGDSRTHYEAIIGGGSRDNQAAAVRSSITLDHMTDEAQATAGCCRLLRADRDAGGQ